MSKRSKHTVTEKYRCILSTLKRGDTKKNRISTSIIQSWNYKYKLNG